MGINENEYHSPVRTIERKGGPPIAWRHWLIGKPLATDEAGHQTISKKVGLAVFASDALSSTAYATQEILVILAAAGTLFFSYAIPISIAIVVLLAIVTMSYVQTIYAYPKGGGAYIVVRENLGDTPAQVAGAAILTDYILTVSVSISSGVAQITSAFPVLYDFRVGLAIFMVFAIMTVNLRGVKESGATFAVPTYFFLMMISLVIIWGFGKFLLGDLSQVPDPPTLLHHAVAPMSLFLILHAFSSGTTALTGVEAISDGIPVFKEPKSRNAAITLVCMSCILAILFVGITFLTIQISAVPSETETVISQLARTVFDSRGVLYLMSMAATALILIMAANTAFADFPRLSAIMAADGFLPRQLTYRGSRLVFSRGIISLALISSGLIFIFDASVTALIPLYAIGVFLSFTLSQSGMARRWWKRNVPKVKDSAEALSESPAAAALAQSRVLGSADRFWKGKMILNSFGAFLTSIVAVIFAVTKFTEGAWIVLVVIPILVVVFRIINGHYVYLASRLSLGDFGAPSRITRHRVILLVSGVHRGTLSALRYARLLSEDLTAVHVSIDEEQSKRALKAWEEWGDGVRMVILDSPYRLMLEPLLSYIDEIDKRRQPNEVITVVVPHFVPRESWRNLLHTNTAFWLRMALMFRPGIVITDVPYLVE